MVYRKHVCFVVSILSIAVYASGQAVSFNTPIPWVTQRNDSIMVRAQIDTAQIKGKSIALAAILVNQGKSKKLLSKSFPINDYSGEFYLGKVGKDLVGGYEFLKIEWSIPGTQEKGSLAPIGIANLTKVASGETIAVQHVKDGVDGAAVVSAIGGDRYKKLGSTSVAFAWNKDALYLVAQKTPDSGAVQVVFDGKSGKNAFLSYPDRVVSVSPVTDSIRGTHYTRDLIGDTIKYTEKSWNNEASRTVVNDKIVVRIPWYDTGVIPFEERTIGFGIFWNGPKGKVTGSIPASAQFFIPATWGDLLLEK